MDLTAFTYCPIASRFIDSLDDARSYYAHRLVALGPHRMTFDGGQELSLVFNPEEIHLFTEDPAKMRRPCAPSDLIQRPGKSREVRCFSVERARVLDAILPTIARPAARLPAKIHRGVQLFGPPDDRAQRLSVVVAPEGHGDTYFVRTMYIVAPKDYAAALRGAASRARWPP